MVHNHQRGSAYALAITSGSQPAAVTDVPRETLPRHDIVGGRSSCGPSSPLRLDPLGTTEACRSAYRLHIDCWLAVMVGRGNLRPPRMNSRVKFLRGGLVAVWIGVITPGKVEPQQK